MNTTTVAYEEGYNACYNGFTRDQNPYPMSSDEWVDWRDGHSDANDALCSSDADDREDFDSGRWTQEDEDSMTRGRDLPMRNEAGEYMY